MKFNPTFWAPVVIALMTAIQVPGMMKGHWYSHTAFVFCLLLFLASLMLSFRR